MPTNAPMDVVVKRFLHDRLDLIRRVYAPQRLIVFGSRSVGLAREESDIDLIVVSEKFRGVTYPNRMGDFLIDIEPDVHVDAICYTPEEFDKALVAQSSFIRDAVAHGLQIE
jgi:uncharacterized protein